MGVLAIKYHPRRLHESNKEGIRVCEYFYVILSIFLCKFSNKREVNEYLFLRDSHIRMKHDVLLVSYQTFPYHMLVLKT